MDDKQDDKHSARRAPKSAKTAKTANLADLPSSSAAADDTVTLIARTRIEHNAQRYLPSETFTCTSSAARALVRVGAADIAQG